MSNNGPFDWMKEKPKIRYKQVHVATKTGVPTSTISSSNLDNASNLDSSKSMELALDKASQTSSSRRLFSTEPAVRQGNVATLTRPDDISPVDKGSDGDLQTGKAPERRNTTAASTAPTEAVPMSRRISPSRLGHSEKYPVRGFDQRRKSGEYDPVLIRGIIPHYEELERMRRRREHEAAELRRREEREAARILKPKKK